jgi:hypothetical protein
MGRSEEDISRAYGTVSEAVFKNNKAALQQCEKGDKKLGFERIPCGYRSGGEISFR